MISAFRNKISSFTPLFVSSYRGIHSKNLARPTSTDPAEVNPKSYESLKAHNWLVYDTKHERSKTTHKSFGEEFVHKIPVIYVDGNTARCLGGTKPGAGHQQVYLPLNTRDPTKPSVCGYCGLKYMKRPHGEGHGHH